MNLTESEQRVMLRIDGTEDIAPYLKPESVLDLMRAAKKMEREIARLREDKADAEADALRLHGDKMAYYHALLEMKCRDDQNGSLHPNYRKIIDDALAANRAPGETMNDLVALLREDAASFAKATQLMADAKSARNQAAGDQGACYSGLTPQQTRAWKAADEIERLQEVKRRSLAIADERAIEAVKARAESERLSALWIAETRENERLQTELSHADQWREAYTKEIEKLRAERRALLRMVWLILNKTGGCVLQRSDLEGFPGDDKIALATCENPATKAVSYGAAVLDQQSAQGSE